MSSSPQRVRFRLRLRKPHTRASVSILSRCCLGCLFHAGRRAHLDPAVTVRAYATAIAQLEAFLIGRGLPTTMADLQAGSARPASSTGWSRRARSPASPMTTIRPPAAPLPHQRVLTGEEIAALLAACAGPDVRDAAIPPLARDRPAPHRAGCAAQLDDVDLDLDRPTTTRHPVRPGGRTGQHVRGGALRRGVGGAADAPRREAPGASAPGGRDAPSWISEWHTWPASSRPAPHREP